MNNVSKTLSEYSLKPFFDLSSDLFCIAGFDGYLKRINPALCKELGYTEEELLSRPINTFVHPEDIIITDKKREQLHEGKKLVNFENRYITKDGEMLWFSWAAKSVKEKKLVYAIARNITHKKKHEEERNRLLSELTKSNQHLKQLNFTTTHDLRSPLSSILSIFTLMDLKTIEDEETREFVQLLETASKNMKIKLDNFIDYQKNQTVAPDIIEVNLSKVLQPILTSMNSLIQETETDFTIDFSAFDTVHFNKTYLESIFLNLISNSIKYAHSERTTKISIKTVEKENQKQLIFSDNGIGFDMAENQNRIFRFNQTFHNHSDSKGIGLYLVYNHISNLGGSILVESEVDKGTVFTINFP